MNQKIIIVLTIILIGIIGAAIYNYSNRQFPVDFLAGEPTTFAESGTIVFNNPGLKPNVPYLIYEEPGKPAVTKELEFDAISFCVTPTGALPCMAMSVSFDIAFHGKSAFVEGISKNDDTVVVIRKLRVLYENEPPPSAEPGNVFIPWPTAVQLIESCKVKMVMQTHALDIYVTLKDDRQFRTVEPMIDEVFRVTDEARTTCGDISLATE